MAESFGSDAERYDRARPEYPRELVDRIVAASPGGDVLDVGCGTGIEARQFRAAGCRVLGVDPDARMAAFARRGGIEVETAKFEDWEPAGRTFDAVVAGQAWHWVDPVAGPAKAARLLRPGGLLAVFAHAFQPPAEVADALAAACRRVLPGLPFAAESRPAGDLYDVMFAGFADALAKADGLGDPERWRFAWERTYTSEEWLDFLPTTGGLTRVPPAELAEVLAEVGAAIDGLGGSFVLPYTTLAVVASKA
ncbi:bifunctional 2-polyprenyl-6-hydroxyphenol methylase/3-demethylubiquinol 3-O-methyltransferase UbiG [Amycolatopsis sp. CA-128772]|uniref:class I SAM-dependent methyltransferase n=1 Tax=Amycolatopsis sp. CA-128772 TaxID=2073159 RepID=UPI000CD17BED|nr:class I SAM-dependent methyltransferase [Amycolatopsis sp. CA-128772]